MQTQYLRTRTVHTDRLPLGDVWVKTPPRRKWLAPLARLLWRILRKLGAVALERRFETVHTFTPSDNDNLLDALYTQHRGMQSVGAGLEDCVVIMGREDFFELTKTSMQPGAFYQPLTLYASSRHGKVLGLPICVSPFVKGVAIIPSRDMDWRR